MGRAGTGEQASGSRLLVSQDTHSFHPPKAAAWKLQEWPEASGQTVLWLLPLITVV